MGKWPKLWRFEKFCKFKRRKNLPSLSDIIKDVKNRKEFMNKLYTRRSIKKIERLTKKQANSTEWFYYRKGMVTATIAKRLVYAVKNENVNDNLRRAIEKKDSSILHYPALVYGRENESQGVRAFYNFMKYRHKNLRIQQVGLKIDENLKFLAGSSDGVVSCSCCSESRLLEIKCPFRLRNSSIKTNGHLLEYLDGDSNLIKSHSYYYQINVCLGVWKCKTCYFVIYTPKDILIKEIHFDEQLFKTMKESVKEYYFKYYLKF